MNILISTLKEELTTSKKLEAKYLQQLALLPQGSFIIRKRGDKQYGYLTRRHGNKVIQEYLGSLSEQQINDYQEKTRRKKNYKQQLKTIRNQIKILTRALRGNTK